MEDKVTDVVVIVDDTFDTTTENNIHLKYKQEFSCLQLSTATKDQLKLLPSGLEYL